jgi:MFS transporter, PAT family, beta-lactamase induction signal transducer AmpG
MRDPKNYLWIPSLYFVQGLPYAIVTVLATIMYKAFGINNIENTFYVSLLVLPWVIKPLWSPLIEIFATQKAWVMWMQGLFVALVLLIAASLFSAYFVFFSVILLVLLAFCSATYDIASDGFYLSNLNPEKQAFYVGIRSLFYQLARMFCSGALVIFIGFVTAHYSKETAWCGGYFLIATVFAVFVIYHSTTLPQQKKLRSNSCQSYMDITAAFLRVFRCFIQLPHVMVLLIFLAIYNAGEVQLMRIIPLFCLDKIEQGGLGLSIEKFGFIYGFLGAALLMLGFLLSGLVVSRLTVRRSIIPITLVVCLTNFGYLILGNWQISNVWIISAIIIIAQFGFGLSNGVYMSFMLHRFGAEEYKAAFYAIGTGFMALGAMFFGAISGFMQQQLNYSGFFIWIFLLGLGILFYTIYTVKQIRLTE